MKPSSYLKDTRSMTEKNTRLGIPKALHLGKYKKILIRKKN